MYKLVIVDDEATIIEGLCNIVDWNALGFEVVLTASDGRDVIEYIDKMPVDAILTDIKMTFLSGLDLAKHVMTNKLDIKVVIMSGYKEFELAREALACNVKYYLLKPTRLEELRKVFLTIREELDAERNRNERIKCHQQEFDELIAIYQEQFFTDLIMGAIRTRELVDKRIKARLEIDPEQSKMCTYNLRFGNEEEDADSQSMKKHVIDTTLNNYTGKTSVTIKYIIVFNSVNNLQILAVALEEMQSAVLEEKSLTTLKKISEKMNTVLGTDIQISHEKTFDNLYEAAAYYKPLIPSPNVDSNKLEDIVDVCDLSHLFKQKKLFLSYVNANNSEMARNLFENFMDELKFMNIKVIRNFIIDLFAGIKSKVEELGVNMSETLLDYQAVFRIDDVEKIRLWGLSLLDDILEYIDHYKATLNSSVIEKAMKYIMENYNRNIGLDEVSNQVFLSSIYFSHLFKQKAGENLVDYLIKVRINKAKELLKESQYRIYEVSEKVGYKNTKYFYKLFKGFTGFTPTEFRENCVKE